MAKRATPRGAIVGFAGAVFIGAFLLFEVEPIMGKLILPWFGGSAAVWTASVLFFQIVLLLGYLYAHASIRYLAPRWQAAVHVTLLGVSLAFLPILPASSWKPSPGQDPTLRILGLLVVTIGLPFLLMSSTGPLLQAWYARRHAAAPYRLYALSNAASLLGLLSYPLVVEPLITTHHQATDWSIGYGVFALLGVIVALGAARATSPMAVAPPALSCRAPVSVLRYSAWVGLAACPSLLFLAVTNHLSQSVAPIPFIWVLPLGLYLISLVVCFESDRWYPRAIFLPLLPLAILAMGYRLSPDAPQESVALLITIFSAGLFVCCMVCHGELARRRPDPSQLTAFYLCLALGGALGGLFVAVIAPEIFPRYFEFQLGLFLCAALVTALLGRGLLRDPRGQGALGKAALGVLIAGCVGLALYLVHGVQQELASKRLVTRNFYGSLVVEDSGSPDQLDSTRMLTNGTTDHGEQFLNPARRRWPTTYYGPQSGIGVLLSNQSRALLGLASPGGLRVGVIGLGAGTLAAYGRRGDYYRIYEINPKDITIAHQQFTFLRDSPARTDIILGDARLSLERELSHHFDVLAADAFTGDAIPIHLLTEQAFRLYFRHLKPGGVLAVHVSNNYLNLTPIVARTATALGKQAVLISNDDNDKQDVFSADWMLVSSDRALLTNLAARNQGTFVTGAGSRPWTDDYSNLIDAL